MAGNKRRNNIVPIFRTLMGLLVMATIAAGVYHFGNDDIRNGMEVLGNVISQTVDQDQISDHAKPDKTPGETPQLKVHFIDVGQADCILIESDGKYMLVDGGNNNDKSLILNYLKDVGVDQFEYVVATHPHEDHIGSLDSVLDEYEAKTIYAPKVEHTSKTYLDFLEAVANQGKKLKEPEPGTEIKLGECSITFLAPNKDYGNDLNNWSIGLKITNGVHTFVMCGDAEKSAETDIVSTGIDLKADVLKLGHHGSSTSTTDTFLQSVSPEYAVISCEINNSYGHPHKETLEKLEQNDIKFFRTDDQGTIIATSDGDDLIWNVEPSKNYKSGSQQQ